MGFDNLRNILEIISHGEKVQRYSLHQISLVQSISCLPFIDFRIGQLCFWSSAHFLQKFEQTIVPRILSWGGGFLEQTFGYGGAEACVGCDHLITGMWSACGASGSMQDSPDHKTEKETSKQTSTKLKYSPDHSTQLQLRLELEAKKNQTSSKKLS